jgi:hypothetical protein
MSADAAASSSTPVVKEEAADASDLSNEEKAKQVAETEKQVKIVLQRVAQLDNGPKFSIDYQCIFDAGAARVGPGGVGSNYVRQCKRDALESTQPPLCYQHARKALLDLVVEGQAKIMRLKGQTIRKTLSAKVGIYDTRKLTLNAAEYEAYKKRSDAGECAPAPKEGGIFGFDTAVCQAFAELDS